MNSDSMNSDSMNSILVINSLRNKVDWTLIFRDDWSGNEARASCEEIKFPSVSLRPQGGQPVFSVKYQNSREEEFEEEI